jgi:hypothetical protein
MTASVRRDFEQEVMTLFRGLPGLLTQGNEGRFVVIKGDRVLAAVRLGAGSYHEDRSTGARLAQAVATGGERPMPSLTSSIEAAGALVSIEVGWGFARSQSARQQLRPVPPPLTAEAMLDTGAEIACVDTNLIQRLGLTFGSVSLANVPAIGGMRLAQEFEVSLRVAHPSKNASQDLLVKDLTILELDLGAVGYEALIGRDVLALCDLLYRGPAGQFTLSY